MHHWINLQGIAFFFMWRPPAEKDNGSVKILFFILFLVQVCMIGGVGWEKDLSPEITIIDFKLKICT